MNTLPPEILQIILSKLSGQDITRCRRVCHRWRQAVDALSDQFWGHLCAIEHSQVHAEAYRKAKLSWRQLHRSLSLWSHVSGSHVRIPRAPLAENCHKVNILSNGIISCGQRLSDACPDNCFDTIVHYDLDTLKEDHRDSFNIFFRDYAESDGLYVLEFKRNNATLIRIIPKTNKDSFVEHLIRSVLKDRNDWFLRGNEVFYQDFGGNNSTLYCYKLVQNSNNTRISLENTVLSENVEEQVFDVAYVGGELNVFLLYDEDRMCIKRLVGTELKLVCNIDWDDDTVHEVIRKCGFDWNYIINNISDWFDVPYKRLLFSKGDNIQMTYASGKVVIIITFTSTIHVFYNPYGENGGLLRRQTKPDKSVNFRHLKKNSNYAYISGLDVVESENGHKIIISYGGIYVIELTHDTKRKRAALAPTVQDCDSPRPKRIRSNLSQCSCFMFS